MNDAQQTRMIRLCQKGHSDGFVLLLKEYGPRLYGFFVRTGMSAADAEDMIQELFLRLLKRIRNYRHSGRFEQWLFRVAANLVRDEYRRRRRAGPMISLANDSDDPDVSHVVPPSPEPGPESRYCRIEQRDQLSRVLQELPSMDREIIMLRHYGQLSFREIAEQFDIPIGTALAKVHRGLKKLRRSIEQDESE